MPHHYYSDPNNNRNKETSFHDDGERTREATAAWDPTLLADVAQYLPKQEDELGLRLVCTAFDEWCSTEVLPRQFHQAVEEHEIFVKTRDVLPSFDDGANCGDGMGAQSGEGCLDSHSTELAFTILWPTPKLFSTFSRGGKGNGTTTTWFGTEANNFAVRMVKAQQTTAGQEEGPCLSGFRQSGLTAALDTTEQCLSTAVLPHIYSALGTTTTTPHDDNPLDRYHGLLAVHMYDPMLPVLLASGRYHIPPYLLDRFDFRCRILEGMMLVPLVRALTKSALVAHCSKHQLMFRIEGHWYPWTVEPGHGCTVAIREGAETKKQNRQEAAELPKIRRSVAATGNCMSKMLASESTPLDHRIDTDVLWCSTPKYVTCKQWLVSFRPFDPRAIPTSQWREDVSSFHPDTLLITSVPWKPTIQTLWKAFGGSKRTGQDPYFTNTRARIEVNAYLKQLEVLHLKPGYCDDNQYDGGITPYLSLMKNLRVVSLSGCFDGTGCLPKWNGCFDGCHALWHLDVAASQLLYLGSDVLDSLINLRFVSLPRALQDLPSRGFQRTKALGHVDLTHCRHLQSLPNFCFESSSVQSVALPPQIRSFGSNCFVNCDALTVVDLRSLSAITTIPSFARSASLREVYLPGGGSTINQGRRSIDKIPAGCFEDCVSLAALDLSGLTALKSLPSAMFKNCKSLQDVKVPTNLMSIGPRCFFACSSLQCLDLSRTRVTTVSLQAFMRCTGLVDLLMPTQPTLQQIGELAFAECASLKHLDLSVCSVVNSQRNQDGVRVHDDEQPNPPTSLSIGSTSFDDSPVEVLVVKPVTWEVTLLQSTHSVDPKPYE